MSDRPHMKKISSFQTRYLKLIRKVKSSKAEKILDKAKTGIEKLLEKYPDEPSLQEAIGKLWVQTIGVFEKYIPNDPKKSANQIRTIANYSSNFLIDKYGQDAGSFIKEIYKAAISLFILLEDRKLGIRIAKKIAIDGAENVRKIEQEDIAKEILKMPFMKIKPKGGMF